ncbi:hypothetical protein [Thalassobellus citreus]|uniref:hypothetical protein n=1 Tax=Thalassobellus citreus TaxID=3367752 RepID=UPI00378E4399
MKTIRFSILIISLLTFSKILGQEILSVKDIYLDENNIAYKIDNDQKFTGFAQKVRNNGHVVYEDEFKDGIILVHFVYFNLSDKELVGKMIYNTNKPFTPEKKIQFKSNKKATWQEIEYYDQDGNKILEETITEGITTYRCEFLNGKKHGTEICSNKEGKKLTSHFKNGKKIK